MRKELNSTMVWQKEGVSDGRPLLKDSRVPISEILDHLALGWSVPQLSKLFPTVKQKYVKKLLQDISKGYQAK